MSRTKLVGRVRYSPMRRGKIGQLFFIGKGAGEQKIGDLLIAEPLVPDQAANQILNVVAAVEKTALAGDHVVILDGVGDDFGNIRQSGENAFSR